MQGLHPEFWEPGPALCALAGFWKEEGFADPGGCFGILGSSVMPKEMSLWSAEPSEALTVAPRSLLEPLVYGSESVPADPREGLWS